MTRPILLAALGVLTVALDTAVNIALPAISAAFDVPATSIQAIVLTYMATFAVALVPAGRLADRAGHTRVFRTGLVLTGAERLCLFALLRPELQDACWDALARDLGSGR